MKTIINNKNNIKDSNIYSVEIRVKALIINNDNIILCNTKNVLHFPGGHKKKNESLKDALIRELKEETGIIFSYKNIGKPQIKIISYDKDYPKKGLNNIDITYYFYIKTKENIVESNMLLTKDEKNKRFKLENININNVKEYIKNNIDKHKLNEIISPDMIFVIDDYLNK